MNYSLLRRSSLFLTGLILVAFGQNAWVGFFGPFAAMMGYALFWRGMIEWGSSFQRFLLSLFWFALAQAFQLSWMASTEYMGALIINVYVFLLLGLGLQFGLLSLLIPSSRILSLERSLAIAGIWVLMEYSRLFLLTGFTWNPVGLAWTTSKFSLQMASLFGIYGLSFWAIFVNLLALRAIFSSSFQAIFFWGSCAVLPFVFGAVQFSFPSHDQRTASVLLVQTEILPEERDYDPTKPDKYLLPIDQWKRILNLLNVTIDSPLDLIVFPEGGVPMEAYRCVYPFSEVHQIWIDRFGINALSDFPLLGEPINQPMSHQIGKGDPISWNVNNAFLIQALANHYQSEVIAGMDDHDRVQNKRYNAAFHFLPNFNVAVRSEKRILVPVGEYVPFKNWKFIAQFISDRYGISDSFDAGERPRVFFGKIPMGVSICYEETYSELIRQLRTLGAQMFVNISNDVWFPHSRLAKQHFDHGMIRAVENGIPLIRACNTGITGGVDCYGRTVALQEESQAGVLPIHMPLNHNFTLYSFWGDWAILLFSLFFALNFWKNQKLRLLEIKKVE